MNIGFVYNSHVFIAFVEFLIVFAIFFCDFQADFSICVRFLACFALFFFDFVPVVFGISVILVDPFN